MTGVFEIEDFMDVVKKSDKELNKIFENKGEKDGSNNN